MMKMGITRKREIASVRSGCCFGRAGLKYLLLRSFLFILCALMGYVTNSQPRKRKAVFVIVDGIPADLISTLNLPYFDSISKTGGFARTTVGGKTGSYTETPTISAVGYNSVLTGTWVNKHNVRDNDIKEPNYHYPSIFRLLKMQTPEKKIAIFSSWEDNRTKLVGEGLAQTGYLKFDYSFDGLEHDKVNFPHDEARTFMHRIDEKVTDSAAAVIRNCGPDLSWVYLEFTDDMGHMYGDGPEFYTAIGYADQQVGRIWNAIRYREKRFNEEWLLIVTTDHGRDAKTGKNHGGQSDREKAGWILTNAGNVNNYFKSGNSSLTDIMPTIARFMNIKIPKESAMEVDGVPVTGPLSFTDLSIEKKGQRAALRWKPVHKTGQIKISLATTNNYKSGTPDTYRSIGSFPVTAGKAEIDLSKYPSGFYKIFAEAEHNNMNIWIPENK